MELVIDTSTRYAAVGLSEAGEIVTQVCWRSAQNHSVELIPAVQRMFDGSDFRIEDLDAVFVAKGPGGFSALRVGMSTAKALAMAGGLPLVAVGTLDVELAPYQGLGLPAWAIIEAGRDILYVARSDGHSSGRGELEYEVLSKDELVEAITVRTLLCGEAAWTLRGWLSNRLEARAVVAQNPLPSRHPQALASLGYDRLVRDDIDDPDTLQPIYIRGSQFDVAHRRWVG